MQSNVEALDFIVLAYAQSDGEIDSFQDDEGPDSAPCDGESHSRALNAELLDDVDIRDGTTERAEGVGRKDTGQERADDAAYGVYAEGIQGVVIAQGFFDRSGGEIAYSSPIMDFRFAHQSTTWGLGEFSQLILSDNVEQFPYISISKHWKWGSFTFMHGKLLSQANSDSIDGQPVYPEKWIAAHRFEFSPSSRVSIGLSELIIYGNRSVEWAYLVPFNFYRATEHYLRDRDNETIALDIEARLFRGGKVYGTVFIDELSTSKLFTDWFGNKHGFQFGLHLADPFHLNNLSLRFEYIAIMPWVYTHRFKINRYIHDGRSLGFSTGPNSQVLYTDLQKEWHYRFKTGIKWRKVKHGDNFLNENIGGDILIGHDTLLGNQIASRQTRDFLEGIITTENHLEFYSQLELFNDLFLDFSISHLEIKTFNSISKSTILHFGFKLDY